MNFLILACVLIVGSVAYQTPTKPSKNPNNNVGIVSSENVQKGDSYSFSYQTEDGQKREEKGSLVNPNTKDEGLEVVGSYSYTKDDKTYIVTYTAGVNGYRPVTKIIQNKPKGY